MPLVLFFLCQNVAFFNVPKLTKFLLFPFLFRSTKPPSEANEFSSLPIRPRPTFVPAIKPENPSTPPPQSLQQDQPIKPVSEETKEEDDEVNHTLVKFSQPSSTFSQSHNNFVPSSSFTPKPEPLIQQQQFRPSQQIFRPYEEEDIAPVQYRPQKPVKIHRKPIVDDHTEARAPSQQTYNKQAPKKVSYREKKPVAQIIRRWREDNDDGSITWGFENDDGSYKEEIIGIDCVTRGKYGYVDPDGLRREYTYETGIRCDEEQQEDENGFVDYQENKLVLPNGKTIDLSSMGKKQTRRPQHIYRN